MLSMRPLTWTGRVSYLIYLWHWPLIIWTTSFIAIASVTAQKLLAIALTVAAATFSYYAVEAPVRFGRIPWLRTSNAQVARGRPAGARGRPPAGDLECHQAGLHQQQRRPVPAGQSERRRPSLVRTGRSHPGREPAGDSSRSATPPPAHLIPVSPISR